MIEGSMLNDWHCFSSICFTLVCPVSCQHAFMKNGILSNIRCNKTMVLKKLGCNVCIYPLKYCTGWLILLFSKSFVHQHWQGVKTKTKTFATALWSIHSCLKWHKMRVKTDKEITELYSKIKVHIWHNFTKTEWRAVLEEMFPYH